MIMGVLLVATSLKGVMLYRYIGFKNEFLLNPLWEVLKLFISTCVEHAVFTATIFFFLSDSLRGKDSLDFNKRLYHALAYPELGKAFVAFLQVWDPEQVMPLLYGILMLSVQHTSLGCVSADKANSVFKAFAAAIILRFLCRLYFHSLFYTLALGIIL